MNALTSVYIATSLDGFIARKNGDLNWLSENEPKDDEGDYGYKAFMDSVDVLVMGRNTYEKVLTFGEWPYADKKVVVLSSNLSKVTENLSEHVEIMSCSPKDVICRLSERGAHHLYIDGGKTIQNFLNSGLINEITIARIPVLIGAGIPLFGELSDDIPLQHIETQVFENGFVQSRYRVIDNTR